jgi:hypothetical protein
VSDSLSERVLWEPTSGLLCGLAQALLLGQEGAQGRLEPARAQLVARDRLEPEPEFRDPTPPVELVAEVRHDELGDAGPQRGGDGAGAAVVDHQAALGEQLGMGSGLDDVDARVGLAQVTL